MWTLLIILSYLITDSANTDPCVNHTVLDQPWRSIDCTETECSGQKKCDTNLVQGWYRFKSSGGWKIPETVVPARQCSTYGTGWLQGSHPSVGQGEVMGTICFNWNENRCHWTQEISIKNCSSYFVYELKPPPGCDAAYCTVTDSALTDPCVHHTVLDQPWRSIDSTETQWKCDDGLHFGWYRFKSSGGWKIPETSVPVYHCSTASPGWLQGSHPSVGQGVVTRTVCFNWGGNHCYWTHEIRIKNCSSYFVYELKSLFYCIAYCTDPETVATEEPEEQSTRESARGSSSTPAVSGTSESVMSKTQESEEQSTAESTEEPVTSQTQESEEQSTRESTEVSSSTPAGSGSSVLDPPTKRNSFSLTTLSSSLLIMNILLKSRLNRLFSTENSPSFSDLFMSLTSLIPGTIPTRGFRLLPRNLPTPSLFLMTVEKFQILHISGILNPSSCLSLAQIYQDRGPPNSCVIVLCTKYKRINVKITSMTDLDEESAKRIVVERLIKYLQSKNVFPKMLTVGEQWTVHIRGTDKISHRPQVHIQQHMQTTMSKARELGEGFCRQDTRHCEAPEQISMSLLLCP
ncbi:uncharacterized protein [Heterodontus francisci]|uniref:uncharacterized protein n=1 Tax=Heterodontus francisci TaxID=7792 RepID=UPI00355B806D